MARPLLIVISSPSGGGKTSLCGRLLKDRKDIVYSISCTTRPPRGNERDGREYEFVDDARFDRLVSEGKLLEHAEVHGYRYGTPAERVSAAFAAGRSVLMDIDVQGAAQIRKYVAGRKPGDALAGALVDIFIAPPSIEALGERLKRRGEDAPETIERRLKNAREELKWAGDFAYCVVNEDLDAAYERLKRIIDRESQDLE